MAPSYQNFPAPQTGTIPSSSATEIWYSATTGSDSNSGASSTAAIKTITQLGRMMWGFGNSGSAILYTDAAFSDSESALFYQMTANDPRQWQNINGALPVTPKFLYLASNYDNQNNATLTDGQILTTTWKNLGSAGSADLTVNGSPTYAAVAAAGKMRNAPAIVFPGTAYFQSGAVAGLTIPITWVIVCAVTTPTTLQVLVTGRNAGTRCTLYTNTSWGLDSNVGVALAPPNPGAGQYNLVYVTFTASAATFAANFVEQGGVINAGTNMVDGITLGANYDGTLKLTGKVLALVGMDNTPPHADVHGFDNWANYNWGNSAAAILAGTSFPQ